MRNLGPDATMQEFREVLADRQLRIDAAAEIGKLGIPFNFEPELKTRNDMLNRRAEARRISNALQASYDRTKPQSNISDEKLNALRYLATEICLVSNMLDLEESGSVRGNSRANAPDLRDANGDRVGYVLTPETLRSEQEIAARLNVPASTENTLGDFFRGVAGMRTSEGIRAALSEGTDSAGGYAVPTVLMPGILAALTPASSLLSAGASIAVLNTQAKSFNIAGVSSIPTAAWRSEAGTLAVSDPAFRSIAVTPRSLAFMFKVSRELLQDSPNIEEALRNAIAQAFAKEMDRAGLRGSGTTPEIRGLLNTSGINSVTNGTNGASLTNYAKFVNAARAIKDANAPAANACIMSPREEEKMALFADSTGQPLRRPDMLQGWKFVTTSQIPTNLTVGTSSDCAEIYIGDFRQFVFFLRENVSVQMLSELYATTGEIGFACHARVDVAALYPSAFSVITGVRA